MQTREVLLVVTPDEERTEPGENCTEVMVRDGLRGDFVVCGEPTDLQVGVQADVTRDEVLLGVLPFFHIYGMVIIMMHGLMRGAAIVTMPKFEFEPFLKVLQDWPIVSAHIVPPIVVALGKLGSRELNYSSDIDLMFVAPPNAIDGATKTARRRVVLKRKRGRSARRGR